MDLVGQPGAAIESLRSVHLRAVTLAGLFRPAPLWSFPPLQVLVYCLPDVILHRRFRVVRELLQCGDLSRQQIGRVSLCDLLTRALTTSLGRNPGIFCRGSTGRLIGTISTRTRKSPKQASSRLI
jgi:hypothetical protein